MSDKLARQRREFRLNCRLSKQMPRGVAIPVKLDQARPRDRVWEDNVVGAGHFNEAW